MSWNDSVREKIGSAFDTHKTLKALSDLAESEPELCSALLDESDAAPERLEQHNKSTLEKIKSRLANRAAQAKKASRRGGFLGKDDLDQLNSIFQKDRF